MNQRALVATALPVALALSVFLTGCRRPTQSPAPVVSYARVDAIVKSSGGNWNKVPPADQKYMIQEFGKGNTRVATMLFNRRASGMVAYRHWMSRVDGMVKSSGGSWNKLSPKEKTYLVDIIGKGDEKAAIKTFQDRAELKKTAAHVTR